MSNRASFHLRLLSAAALSGLILIGQVSAVQAQVVMKLATATMNDAQEKAIRVFGAAVEKRSGGRIKAEYYPGAQLGSNQRMIEGIQLGTIEVYVGPPAYLVSVDSRYQVLDAPGLFKDAEHFFRVSQDDDFRKQLLGLGDSKGIKGLSLFMYGPTAVASRAPIRTLADFKGKKIRVLASKLERESMNKLGATAVPIDMSEVSSALQQGTVDGMKSSVLIFSAVKLFDIVKFVTMTNEAIIPEVLVVGKPWFDSQPQDIQKILVEEGKAMERELFDWTIAAHAKAETTWKEKGGEVIQLSAADREKMMADLSTVASDVLSEKPGDKALFEVLKASVAKNAK